MQRHTLLAAGLLAMAAGGAFAADKAPRTDADGARHEQMHKRHHRFGPSVEHAAMHNIMAGLIASKTGRSEAEVRKLFEDNGPREAIDKLGLSRDDLRALREQAHEQLVKKAAEAGLITAEQAARIRAMPRPEHGPGEERGDSGD